MHGTLQQAFASSSVSIPSTSGSDGFQPLAPPQPSLGAGHVILIALLFAAMAGLLAPFWLLADRLAADPAARAVVSQNPVIALQLGLGLALLLAIFGWPLAALVRKGLVRRDVRIDGAFVSATDAAPWGERAWREPLGAYMGLQRRVRSSLSGLEQELVLVHPHRSRSVVVQSAAHIPQDAIDFLAQALDLAEIRSREATSVHPMHGLPHAASRPSVGAAVPLEGAAAR